MHTICLVDDNPDIIGILSMLLSRDEFRVISAPGGGQCIDLLRSEIPDLILLDVMMEPMDGWETLERLKNNPRTTGIPVIMLSGKNPTPGELEKYESCFIAYMRKPVRYRDLFDTIMSVLEPGRSPLVRNVGVPLH